MRKMTLVLAAATLLTAGCATDTTSQSATVQPVASAVAAGADEATASAAIAAAETSRAAAAAVGYEWRDTAQLIDDAKKAAAEKDFDKAVKLAKQAEHQGKAAAAQFEQQNEAYKKR